VSTRLKELVVALETRSRQQYNDVVPALLQISTGALTIVELIREEAAGIVEIGRADSETLGRRGVFEKVPRIANGFDGFLLLIVAHAEKLERSAAAAHSGITSAKAAPQTLRQLKSQLEVDVEDHHVLHKIVLIAAKIVVHTNAGKQLLVNDRDDVLDATAWAATIDNTPFMTRSFGLQYEPGVRNFLSTVNATRLSTLNVSREKTLLNKLSLIGRSVMNGRLPGNPSFAAPDNFTTRVDPTTVSIDAVRGFMNLAEQPVVTALTSAVTPDVAVNQPFVIATGSNLPAIQGRYVSVKPRAKEMTRNGNDKDTVRAKVLIFHIHGGGFIAQSSASHSVYLKEWAVDMPDALILSLDYRLAPEDPYPAALEDCFRSYEWALQNADKIGCDMEKIVFVGDSAGGNLVLATTFMCAEREVRLPDALVLGYPALYLTSNLSPSRLFSFFDALLPFDVLKACLDS